MQMIRKRNLSHQKAAKPAPVLKLHESGRCNWLDFAQTVAGLGEVHAACFVFFFPFEEWTTGLEGYSLSSRRNIALRNDSQSCGVLYSKAPTYFCGQTLTFRQVLCGWLLSGASPVNQASSSHLLQLNCV